MMENKEKNFVSAVIYVHNAENVLADFLRTVIHVFEKNFEQSEIICVNDGSKDNSRPLIEKISEETRSTCLTVVNMSYFHGLELAMNAGTDLSIGDFVFEFDNTALDFEPDEIMRAYWRELEGFDIVSVTADRPARLTSRIFYTVLNRYAENPQKRIGTESFRILSRRAINRVSQMSDSIPYRKVAYALSGLCSDTIVYKGTVNKNARIPDTEKKFRLNLAVDSLLMFTDLGYKVSIAMSLLMLLLTSAVIVYTCVARALGNPVEGWTSIVLFVAASFWGLFVILTIVVKYLQILIRLVFRKQQYCIENVEKLTK